MRASISNVNDVTCVTTPRDATARRSDAVHLARQPILDARGSVFGYELLYRGEADATACDDIGDRASAHVLSNAVLALGLDTLTAGRPAFINFTRGLLLSEAATLLPPSALVIEVREDVPVDADLVDACSALHDRGYAIGLDDFVSGSPAEALLPFVKFVKVDVLETPLDVCAALAARFRAHGIRLIAEKVECATVADALRPLGYQLFQGYYFCRPTTFTTAPMAGRQIAYLQLLAALNREDLPVSELEDLVKADVSLTYRVLRSVNSPAFGLRREITSIRQALLLLGRDRIRKWVSVWTLAGLSTGHTEEMLAIALVRARCCEALGRDLAGHECDSGFFLLGLCSVLDAILKRPMAAAIAEMPLPVLVKDALLGLPNPAREVLDAVRAYEQGAWDGASRILHPLRLPIVRLIDAYRDALSWTRGLATDAPTC
ncbi:MAG: HDOD domain-containing protein [Vicinamibacterales bacterium]